MAVIAAATVALLVPSCTRTVDDARAVAGERPTTAEADESACTPVDAPLVIVPTDPGEPVLKIPQPSGWERFTEMDSDMIRYTMRNTSLASTAVVTFESVAEVGDPDEALEGMREGMLELLGADADLDITRHTQCGLTAETIHYVNPGFGQATGPMPATALAVVMVLEDSTHVVSVNVLTKQPGDPIYARDAETIITGFQMLPPSPS
jgi:hypothetical protein